jgi:hypothetical protein
MPQETGSGKWEYTAFFADVGGTMTSSPLNIWDKKHKHLNNNSYWEQVMELGKDGWEMVSASPWCGKGEGLTTGILFVFKRLIEHKQE